MDLQVTENDDGILRARLIGRLDMMGTTQIEDQFTFNVSTRKAPVVVDLSDVDFIASIGMRMLVKNAKAIGRRGGKMGLYAPQPTVLEALQTAGIDVLIPVYEDWDVAAAELIAAVDT